MDWVDQDVDPKGALVNTIIIFRASYSVATFLSSYSTGSFSRRALFHEVTKLVASDLGTV
jgi:hypothetical protein